MNEAALRNAKKLAIALDALRDIRDESAGAGDDYTLTLANNALDRIEALGPTLDEILPGDDAYPDRGAAENAL